MNCPVCHVVFDPRETEAMPFCSHRCREIDLGRWLEEDYSLPHDSDPDTGGSQTPAENGTRPQRAVSDEEPP